MTSHIFTFIHSFSNLFFFLPYFLMISSLSPSRASSHTSHHHQAYTTSFHFHHQSFHLSSYSIFNPNPLYINIFVKKEVNQYVRRIVTFKERRKENTNQLSFCFLAYIKQENDNEGNLAVRKRQNSELIKLKLV